MNNQIDPMTVMLFFALICSVCCTMAAYNFGKVDGSKKATNDWNKLLEESQKNNAKLIAEYKELIDELMHTIENKSLIIEEFKKLDIEDVKGTKKEPVQRLWKVGDKCKHRSALSIAKVEKMSNDRVFMSTLDNLPLVSYSIEEVDKYFNEGIWILVHDNDPVDGC